MGYLMHREATRVKAEMLGEVWALMSFAQRLE